MGAAGRVLAPLATQFEVGPIEGWPTHDEVAVAVDRLDDVLATWGGEPYADLPDHPDVLAARSSLERLRAAAEEARLLGLLAVGAGWSDRGYGLTGTGQATALEALRARATGPRTIPWP